MTSPTKSAAPKGVAGVDVLAVIGKPLRKIVRVIRHADSIYGTQSVELECGHTTSASSRAFGRARCRKCQQEIRAAVAELIEADREYDAARKAWDALAPSGIGEIDSRSEADYERLRAAKDRRDVALAALAGETA